MTRTMIIATLMLTLIAGACAADVTESDEYQTLENELVTVQQQLSDTEAELATVQAEIDETAGSEMALPDEVAALVNEWWAANDRGDGPVTELYLPNGYHLYGSQRIPVDEVADHFGAEGWTSELIAGPYLVAAEPEGRYVVTVGVRNANENAGMSAASALTFEIVTRGGELKIAQTGWTYVTS